MKVICKKCSQEYEVPEKDLERKKFYFFCDTCNHRIVIDNRLKAEESPERGFDGHMSFGGILDGVALSFNLRNTLLIFGFLMFWTLFTGLLSYAVSAHGETVMQYRALSSFGLLAYLIALVYSFQMLLYVISRNTLNLMKERRNMPL